MTIRHLAEPALRKLPTPIPSFLVPSYASARHSSRKIVVPLCKQGFRQLTTSSAVGADEPDSPAPDKKSPPPTRPDVSNMFRDVTRRDSAQGIDPSARSASPYARRKDTSSRINAKLDELFPGTKSTTGSSASDVANAFAGSRMQDRRGSLRAGGIASNMLMPNQDSSSSYARQVAQSVLADSTGWATRNKRTVRSRPSIGRTIEVEPATGIDFGRAVKTMEVLLARNKVRQDTYNQKFHERGGMKRKRLKSERWRRYFKEGFLATISRVKKMRRQGW